MKVLQVNSVYQKGSTGEITYNIHTGLLKQNINSIVCYGRGDKVQLPFVYKTCWEIYAKLNKLLSMITGIMYGGCFISTYKLINIIKKEKPDIVHLQCINGNFVNIYKLISFLKHSKINTVITLHAEFMYTGSCGIAYDCEKWKTGCGTCPLLKTDLHSIMFDRTSSSWEKMRRIFSDMENLRVVSVSPWLDDRVSQAPVFFNKSHKVIMNGINTNLFKVVDCKDLRKSLQLRDEKIILFVTASLSNENKGGKYIFELMNLFAEENVKMIVVGNKGERIINYDNIIDVGRIDNNLLPLYYSLADVSIILSRRETFSMPVAESMCCGTPVVGFEAGGPESIALKKYSRFVEYGDIDNMKKQIETMFELNLDCKKLSDEARKIYSNTNMINNYIELYNSMYLRK